MQELTINEIENVNGGLGPLAYWGIAAAIGFGVGVFGSWSSGRRHIP